MYICALEIVPTFFKCLTNITFYKSWASLLAKLIQNYPTILWWREGLLNLRFRGHKKWFWWKFPLIFTEMFSLVFWWMMFSWFGSILIKKSVLTFYNSWASSLAKLIQNYLPILWCGGGVTRFEVLGSQEIILMKIPLTFYGNV